MINYNIKLKVDETTNKKIQFADCKYCNHAVGLDCISANCTCCRETDHSMVLDGMEGFSSS